MRCLSWIQPAWRERPTASTTPLSSETRSPRGTFTGETLANASLRMLHSREVARALFILGAVLGDTPVEALSLCESVRQSADGLKAGGRPLFCCGPCTVSVWRLAGIGASVASEESLDHLLSALPAHRDRRGAWRRFPFFFTVLALSELDHPRAAAELEYARPGCERKRPRLAAGSLIAARRIALLDRVLA